MPLEREYLNIDFTGGTNEDIDPRIISQPFVKTLENFVSDKQGSISVRNYRAVDGGAAGIGANKNPKMAVFGNDILVVTDRDYGVFRTSTSEYDVIGTTAQGYSSDVVGVGEEGSGSCRVRICNTSNDNHIFSTYNTHDSDGNATLVFRVHDRNTGSLIFSDSVDGQIVLDVVYTPGNSAVTVFARVHPDLGATPSTADKQEIVTHYFLASGTTYTRAASNASTPTGSPPVANTTFARQLQAVSDGSSTIGLIVNYFPEAYSTAAYGYTYVATCTTGVITNWTLVSDGLVGTVDKDGSAMVACGYDSSAPSGYEFTFATCSRRNTTMYMWAWDPGTAVSASSTIQGNMERDYGPLFRQADPTQVIEIWDPSLGGGLRDITTTGSAAGGSGGQSPHPQEFDTYGHNFMYGYVERDASGALILAWHGGAQFAILRRIQASGNFVVMRPVLYGSAFRKITRATNTFTPGSVIRAHNTLLLSRPVAGPQTSKTVWPVAVGSKWYFTLRDFSVNDLGNTQGFFAYRHQMALGIGNVPLGNDSGLQYLCGATIELESSAMTLQTTSLFGQDEIMPHTSPVPFRGAEGLINPTWNYPGNEVVDATNWAQYDCHTTGLATFSDGSFAVGGHRWTGLSVPPIADGPQSALAQAYDTATGGSGNHEFGVANWGDEPRVGGNLTESAACYVLFSDPSAQYFATPEYAIIDTGRIQVFDGTSLNPLDWYIPPQPVLPSFEQQIGTEQTVNNVNKVLKCTAVWAYTDARGTVWRSAPALTQTNANIDWRMTEATVSGVTYVVDRQLTVFSRPLPSAADRDGNMVIEYYTNYSLDLDESDADLWEPAADLHKWAYAPTNSKYYTLPAGIGGGAGGQTLYEIFGLSIGWTLEPINIPQIPLYTTGGVLEDEPPVASKSFTFASGRVWYIKEGKAYFSKQVQSKKPIGFNANLFISSPVGEPLVAVSSMDEYVVLFSENQVFVAEGTGPNDLGRGSSFVPIRLSSPVGCRNPAGVLSTHLGVFFPGPDTMYLLRRDMQVVRIGNIEDSLDPATLKFATHQPSEQMCFWAVGDPPNVEFLVFNYEQGWWGKWTGLDVQNDTTGVVVNDTLYTAGATGNVIGPAPAATTTAGGIVRTGWIHLDQMAGFKRFRNCYLVGAFSDPGGTVGTVQIKYYYDYSDTPAETRTYQVSDLSSTAEILRHKPARQKCAAFSMEVVFSATNGTLSHMAAEVGLKRGPGVKVPRD